MELLSIIAVILLTLVGYSSGNVLVRRGWNSMPSIFDLLGMVLLWWLALAIRDEAGKWWAIAAGLAIGLVAGLVVGSLRPARERAGRELPHAGGPAAGGGFLGAWKRFALRMGNFQSRMFMGFFYFIVVTPFALISILIKDDKAVERGSKTFWRPRPIGRHQLDQARNQF